MNPHKYLDLKEAIIKHGYEYDITWSENIKLCDNSADFVIQHIFVVCNSGMKAQIAQGIYEKILQAIIDHRDISTVFKYEGKVEAMKEVIKNQKMYFGLYQMAINKIDFLEAVPFIGPTTKYHLAKNLGVDCVKPDRHLVRIAKTYNTNCFDMCQKLSDIIGDSVATVDTVIWRAANLRLI